ncbi:class I SAM-dependent methyltransferase [Lentzea sp. NPDC060358]|uniref:class I SAM-dependent methyltransferase n=1 Tax=Lentzea sp. NPDC060358 TaxID=3347103 RepID=UPI00364E30D1
MTAETNSEQAAFWNTAGHGWAHVQDVVARVLRPYQDLLVEAATRRPRERVLDVGCGTGGTTRAIAEATGARCVGIDISESMLAAAREHGQAEFLRADAQVHSFDRTFDLVVSRFGVMFFDDPVAAFANLRRATAAGGELCFITWRTAGENPFMTTASRVAASLLPDAPAPDPDGPGPFSFAVPQRTREILEGGGWTGVEIEAQDRTCTMPEELLTPYLSNMGPVARALRAAPEAERGPLLESVLGEFREFVRDGEVHIPGGVWRVTASAPL